MAAHRLPAADRYNARAMTDGEPVDQRVRPMQRMRFGKGVFWGLMTAAVLTVSGCASFFGGGSQRGGVSSSVVDFLYPRGTKFEPATAGTPQIRLPARVGLMFVPSTRGPVGVTQADRQRLLEKVRETFRSQPFIERIDIVPDTYLRSGGGFENLDQVARMHGVDVVALVSYDQVLRTEETAGSLLYWTIVGAYTIPANRNQVSTFVETTVFDVASHTLLLRAPGQDQRQAASTAIRVGDVRERVAGESFQVAMDDMTRNLDQAIVDFGKRAREEKQVKLVDRRSGGSWGGGGSVQWWELALLGLVALALVARRR